VKKKEEVHRVLYQVIYYPTSRLDRESARVDSERKELQQEKAPAERTGAGVNL
jgi:hypothetical protein